MEHFSETGKRKYTPRHGDIYNIMKKTKNIYHLTVRRVQNLGDYRDNCRLLDGSALNEDLFATIRKSRKENNSAKVIILGNSGKMLTNALRISIKNYLTLLMTRPTLKV